MTDKQFAKALAMAEAEKARKLEMDLALMEVAQISAVISDTTMKPLYELVTETGNGYMECISIIGGWAVEFYQQTKDCSDWEKYLEIFPGYDCWDDLVMGWASIKLQAYKKAIWM
jgi:hypothetical protein